MKILISRSHKKFLQNDATELQVWEACFHLNSFVVHVQRALLDGLKKTSVVCTSALPSVRPNVS